jgi:hypothetical protein
LSPTAAIRSNRRRETPLLMAAPCNCTKRRIHSLCQELSENASLGSERRARVGRRAVPRPPATGTLRPVGRHPRP